MSGHTGGCMPLGKGIPISISIKQKLNTHSSTETELIAVDDFMLIILWTNYFLKAQGYGHQDTILYQDNQKCNSAREELPQIKQQEHQASQL